MKQFYYKVIFAFILALPTFLQGTALAQSCDSLKALFTITESRCAATGSITITAAGGSGNYQYSATGPVNVNYTSSNILSGLQPGSYVLNVKDIATHCVYSEANIIVPGSYTAPNFTMLPRGVTCHDGNDGRITVTGQTNGRGPFSYSIIAPSASAVGTVSASGIFTGLISGNYLVQLRDSCGGIQTRSVIVENYDWSINSNTVTKIDCDSILVTLGLLDSKWNTTPHVIFNGFRYGASGTVGDTTWFTNRSFRYYKGTNRTITLLAKDLCGNIKSVMWTEPRPTVASAVALSNWACNTITATITGQQNLTAPQYCIYDKDSVEIACNTTGIFTSLPYGSYCIKIKDICYDTTISRCFTAYEPIPSVSDNVGITTSCNSVTATITGQSNLNNPNYCLYDENDVSLGCNTTGIFANIPYGTYCIRIQNNAACYDTLIVRCFTVRRPAPTGNISVINLACSTITVTVTDTANWTNPQYCLYTASLTPIACNSTGIFTNLPYGSYCLDMINGAGCYDTTITRCFTVTMPVPSLDNIVSITNKTCTGFSAAITGQANLFNPQYKLYNGVGVLLDSNLTGTFNNLPYGSYCIRTVNDAACADTSIERCFNVDSVSLSVAVSSWRSCSMFKTNITVNLISGNAPYKLRLHSPDGDLLRSASNVNTPQYIFYNLHDLLPSQKYRIVVTDACGNPVTDSVAPDVSKIYKTFTQNGRCPSTINPNGSKDVTLELVNTNVTGTITTTIIRKNGAAVNIPANSQLNNRIFTFLELGPGTYIFDTWLWDCYRHSYDTVVVHPYYFPNLSGTRAYQCDLAGFSVNVNPSNGLAPYTYEIFGSLPSSPSIIAPPQASPVFMINNGTAYSLIRMRAIDACGNAALYDASILPLANFMVYPDRTECFDQPLTLTVDSSISGDYRWYKKLAGDDSLLVATGPSYHIPMLNSTDTGRYFCRIVMNSGCLIKYANYIITGFCSGVLPLSIQLAGKKQSNGNKLTWPTAGTDVKEYILERKTGNNNYQAISVTTEAGGKTYSFLDEAPASGNNFYRLQIKDLENRVKYSNEVLIKNTSLGISVYPNPVQEVLNISVGNGVNKTYLVEVNSIAGQKVISRKMIPAQNNVMSLPRSANIKPGVYLLTVTEAGSNEKETIKIIYN